MISELEHLCSLWEKANKKETGEPYCKVSRSTTLIVPEVTYFSKQMDGSLNNSSWAYDVPYAFRDALDIKFEQRMKKKKSYMVWTQGPLINFKEGDLLHTRCGAKSVQVSFSMGMGWDAAELKMYNGIVHFRRYEKINGVWVKGKEEIKDQMEFLEMLIVGEEKMKEQFDGNEQALVAVLNEAKDLGLDLDELFKKVEMGVIGNSIYTWVVSSENKQAVLDAYKEAAKQVK